MSLHMFLPRQDNGGGNGGGSNTGGNGGGSGDDDSGTAELLKLLSDPFGSQVRPAGAL